MGKKRIVIKPKMERSKTEQFLNLKKRWPTVIDKLIELHCLAPHFVRYFLALQLRISDEKLNEKFLNIALIPKIQKTPLEAKEKMKSYLQRLNKNFSKNNYLLLSDNDYEEMKLKGVNRNYFEAEKLSSEGILKWNQTNDSLPSSKQISIQTQTEFTTPEKEKQPSEKKRFFLVGEKKKEEEEKKDDDDQFVSLDLRFRQEKWKMEQRFALKDSFVEKLKENEIVEKKNENISSFCFFVKEFREKYEK